MANTLYLDCFAGVSGDMFIGALIDCGLDFNLLRSELKKLGVGGYDLSVSRVNRSGIFASKFDVHLDNEHDHHGHSHEHDHEHNHDHDHNHDHRSLSEIKRIINSSDLSERVKDRAQLIFQRIGEAEAKIHNVPIETIHFHEVGAL